MINIEGLIINLFPGPVKIFARWVPESVVKTVGSCIIYIAYLRHVVNL